MREIEAGVDASFSKQRHPVFRPGSPKWIGLQKWGFYIDLFFRLSAGEQASLAISPREWIRCWEEQPRLMAVLKVVQDRARSRMAEESRDNSEKMRSKVKRGRHV